MNQFVMRLQLADQRHQHAGGQHQLGHSGAAVRLAHALAAAAAAFERPEYAKSERLPGSRSRPKPMPRSPAPSPSRWAAAQRNIIGAASSTPAANTIYAGNGVTRLPAWPSHQFSQHRGHGRRGDQQRPIDLTLTSQTPGSGGALSVNSAIVATGDTPLELLRRGRQQHPVTSTRHAELRFPAQTIRSPARSPSRWAAARRKPSRCPIRNFASNTLSGLADAINAARHRRNGLGGAERRRLIEPVAGLETAGSAGALTVTSNILDTTNHHHRDLNYTNSSDINSLTNLGISVTTTAR